MIERSWRRFLGVALLASLILSGACGDAGEPAAGAEEELGGGGVVTIFTDRTELFFEHPPLLAGVPSDAWAIHLTDLSTFLPVTEGRLTLEFAGPDGSTHRVVAEEPSRPGHYGPSTTLPAPGMYDLLMILEGDQVSDEIFVGPMRVFASAGELPTLPPEESVGISFLKEQQWPIDFRTVEAVTRELTPGMEVTGTLTSAPGALVEITAPVGGIVRWDLNRDAPAAGARVAAGQPLVRLSPVGGDDTYATLRASAERLRREVERAERLVAADAVPARRLEESRHDLEVVEAQLAALDASADDGYILTLRAPIAGAVLDRAFVTGERVEAGARLMSILDPRWLQLRFDVPAPEVASLGDIVGATFSPEGSDEVLRTTRLHSVGAALDAVRRTLPVVFEVDNASGVLKAGMLVQGRILTGAGERGVTVPSSAIVDEDGLLVAYVQIGGETFERRAVRLGPTDGEWAIVRSGVRSGERVVTLGQYQIKLSSLNTSEISDHGHPH